MTTTTQTVVLTDDYAKFHMARSVPGAIKEGRTWVLADPTPRSAAIALRLFPELTHQEPWLCELRDQLAQDVRPFDNATPYDTPIEAENVRRQLEKEGKTFYAFQEIDLGYLAAVLETHGGAYLGWERGLGKTLGACALIDDLDCNQVLVVAPNTAKVSVWAAEVERWLPWMRCLVLPNQREKRERMMREVRQLVKDNCEPFVLIVHYEALSIITGKKAKKRGKGVELGAGWAKYGKWDLVVADEAHRIKEPKAQMARSLKKVPSHKRLALSGSIIQNHAEELFSVLQWLFPTQYSSKWRDWNNRYLDYIFTPYRTCIGVLLEKVEEMRQELGVFMVYRRKEDELDLPLKTEQTLLVDISPAQRVAYDELLRTCLTELDDGTRVKAAEGLVMLTRLRQIASGLDLLARDVTDSSKLDLAMDLITDNPDEAFVVFTWYKANAHTLADRLQSAGVGAFVVDGDVPHEARADYIERFQAGEGRVFIGTLSTLGESVTLHRATNAIFIDRSWNPATNVQAADRIYRIGQEKPVTITHLVARNTVDEYRVLPAIANKEALRRAILGGI